MVLLLAVSKTSHVEAVQCCSVCSLKAAGSSSVRYNYIYLVWDFRKSTFSKEPSLVCLFVDVLLESKVCENGLQFEFSSTL